MPAHAHTQMIQRIKELKPQDGRIEVIEELDVTPQVQGWGNTHPSNQTAEARATSQKEISKYQSRCLRQRSSNDR